MKSVLGVGTVGTKSNETNETYFTGLHIW